MDGVAVTFTVFGSLCGLIHLAVSFPACINGCYNTPLHQVRTCFSAHCDLRIQLSDVSTPGGILNAYTLYYTFLCTPQENSLHIYGSKKMFQTKYREKNKHICAKYIFPYILVVSL